MKNTLKEESVSSKISQSDKKKIEDTIESTLRWIESNLDASKLEYQNKQKELNDIIQPIMTKLYQQQGGQNEGQGNFGGQNFGGQSSGEGNQEGPTVHEVD